MEHSTDREKVIKELHDARRYLEDKEWSDRGASPHIDAINDALALLKEQKAKTVIKIAKRFNDCDLTGFCPFCHRPLIKDWAEKYCGYCGNPVLWEGRKSTI